MPEAGAPEPIVKPTRFTVNCVPETVPQSYAWSLHVEHTGNDRWAVRDDGSFCLNTAGTWDYEPIPSERTPEWLAEHRFDVDTALELAKQAAPKAEVNGRTVADVIARWEARG